MPPSTLFPQADNAAALQQAPFKDEKGHLHVLVKIIEPEQAPQECPKGWSQRGRESTEPARLPHVEECNEGGLISDSRSATRRLFLLQHIDASEPSMTCSSKVRTPIWKAQAG